MDLFDHAAQTAATPINTGIAIERGIPIPAGREHTVKSDWERPDFRFSDMEVGDSFQVWPHDCGGPPLIVVQNMVSGAVATYRNKNGRDRKFTTRQIQGQYVRCWRVE